MLKRFGIGRAGAIELEKAEVPLGCQLGAGRKQQPAVNLHPVAGVVEGQQLGVVPLLLQQHLDERVGRAEGTDRYHVTDHAVEVNEGNCVLLRQDEVFLRHVVEKVLDEVIEGSVVGLVGVVVGDIPQMGEHRQKLGRHQFVLTGLVMLLQLASIKVQQRTTGH